MVVEPGATDRRSPATAWRDVAVHALGLFALCGLAVAQPVFAMLGEEPTYFVVHGIEGFDLVLFALALVLVPPAVLTAGLVLANLVSGRVEQVVMTGLVGALVALTVVPALDRASGLSAVAFLSLLLLVAAAGALVYAKVSAARTFVSFLAPAPVLFLVLFLGVSPASALLGQDDVALLPAQGSPTPVVMVIFDEQALGVLVTPDGEIDAARFPGFARLAATSTWYPKATTISLSTHLAVPAMLSGTPRSADTAPTAEAYPHSLFTMLGASHEVRASEHVTTLCPEDLCAHPEITEGSVDRDTAVAYLHSVLPDGLADDWLPPLGARWGDFTDADDPADESAEDTGGAARRRARSAGDQPAAGSVTLRFRSFLGDIERRTERPELAYHHMALPHIPYRFLPDGTEYDPIAFTFGLEGEGALLRWTDDAAFMDEMAQRLVLQTGYVDRLVDALLDRLEHRGLLDDALVIVTADHGISMQPGGLLRGPVDGTGPSRHEVQPVPLFVKYPRQRAGVVDDRVAQVTDVLPTVADALEIDLPDSWKLEGRSLLAPEDPDRVPTYMGAPQASDLDPTVFSARLRSAIVDLPGRSDFVGVAPYGSLVGRRVEELQLDERSSARLRLDAPRAVARVHAGASPPALVTGDVEGLGAGAWLAVSVDGVIAGTGPVYGDDPARTAALLDPKLLTPGRHDVRAFVVDESGALLHEVELGG